MRTRTSRIAKHGLWVTGTDTALLSRGVVVTPIETLQRSEFQMRKINVQAGRLALNKETVRKLGAPDLVAASAGWECSVTGSGKVMCSPGATGEAVAGKIASS